MRERFQCMKISVEIDRSLIMARCRLRWGKQFIIERERLISFFYKRWLFRWGREREKERVSTARKVQTWQAVRRSGTRRRDDSQWMNEANALRHTDQGRFIKNKGSTLHLKMRFRKPLNKRSFIGNAGSVEERLVYKRECLMTRVYKRGKYRNQWHNSSVFIGNKTDSIDFYPNHLFIYGLVS